MAFINLSSLLDGHKQGDEEIVFSRSSHFRVDEIPFEGAKTLRQLTLPLVEQTLEYSKESFDKLLLMIRYILDEAGFDEEFKKVALRMNRDGQIEDMTYEILTDKEKNAVGDVCVRLSSLYKSNELLAHKKSFVSFFPEDDELVMSKDVLSEVSVPRNIDIFSETFMKSYDENVGETLLIAEGKMKIIHGLMEAICNMMSNVFSIDTRRRLRIVYDGDDTRLEGYITPYMSWEIYLKTSALITSQLKGHLASTGNPERKDEPFSVLLMSDIMVSPKKSLAPYIRSNDKSLQHSRCGDLFFRYECFTFALCNAIND